MLRRDASFAPLSAPSVRRGPTWRAAIVAVMAFVFVAIVIRDTPTSRLNSEDGMRAIAVAKAIHSGRARWGLIDYTHHPMAPAYLMLPALWVDRPDLMEAIPAAAGVLVTGVAFGVLLYIAPWPLWPGVVASFVALSWQPGYREWLRNTWQHSWNLSIVFVLIALGCAVARAAWWLVLVGYVAGWIGYDFVFVQVATLVAVRLAFWSQLSPWRTLLAVIDDTVALVTGIALAVLSHLVQNTLYFSSAGIAVVDLFGAISIRVNNSDSEVPTLAMRLALLLQLAGDYVQLFLKPMWTHWQSLAAAAVIVLAGVLLAWRHVSPPRRVAAPLAGVIAASVGGLIAWWLIAPGHAIPHPHFFPRMLLVPLLAILAGAVRVLSVVPPPAIARWRWSWRYLLVAATLVAVQRPLLNWIARSIDDRVYTHVWATPDSAPRSDRIGAPFLRATSPQAPGPARLKGGKGLVGGVNTWALNLDNEAWQPAPKQPTLYETRFLQRAAVSDVLLRFPGPARPNGNLRMFTIGLAGSAPLTTLTEQSPGVEITEVGHLRGFHYHLDPPVAADGLLLVIRECDAPPIVMDLLAFGHPVAK